MRSRSVLSVLAALLLVLALAPGARADGRPSAVFAKTSDWGSGWQARFTLTNGSGTAINGWRVAFDLPAGTSIGSFWDAVLTKDGQHQTFVNRDYNATIPAGGSVTFGFLGSGPGSPEKCTFNGQPCEGASEPGGLGRPGAPGITARTDSSLTLSWSAGSGTPTGYRVYEGADVRATVSGTSAVISGLDKCSTHTYMVKAYGADGESDASDAVTGTTSGCATGPLPRHFLTGYWQDFVNAAQELKLSQVPDQYDLIAVAFGEATATPGEVAFQLHPELSSALGGYTDAQFKADIAALHAKGKKVILSVGGEKGAIRVSDAASAAAFAGSMSALMSEYGFDGVDIDLENGLNPAYMEQALRSLRAKAGDLIITMAPQTVDMQSTGGSYFQLALKIKDILTVVNMQYYNSGAMLGCDQKVYGQGSVDFMTALACIQLENGLRPDQVALGLPAGPGAAGGGVVAPSIVDDALDCLAKGTGCGSFKPPHTYPDIRGAMTWSINWDVTDGGGFARTVGAHLDTLP
ncbi:chitinase [Actinomadura opuntiae]|uniref:chitinase n=1 Tax=Actinomadura sp. OS1-43 TaxID=604315 RepID=UPI00255AB50D|nr:cellulose binding domain-containing protein [Actinomadura sp. OS1-43]MDL4817416.1 glycosyl hydrolase family 18 protein [Actinomadura sp. OS1-43]